MAGSQSPPAGTADARFTVTAVSEGASSVASARCRCNSCSTTRASCSTQVVAVRDRFSGAPASAGLPLTPRSGSHGKRRDAPTQDEKLGMLRRPGLNVCWEVIRDDPTIDEEQRLELLQAARLLREWAAGKAKQ